MKIRKHLGLWLSFLLFIFLTACQTQEVSLKDGTFEGVSSKDDEGAYGKVKIIINNEKIEEVEFQTIQKDGSIKDSEYGKRNGTIVDQNFYNKAQLAVNAMKSYGQELEEKQSLDEVEVISGATISYNQFKEAVEAALASNS
ncbi:MAG: FMN-binding protein [Streptococcaceae bacterium]|jgi:major membrane immunogen (membrane-anchored lipoprotein)|nr:FMN-binding protein [Streptococcaceae bacterium]MCH4178216.1 FMN-binding protein [Streptococcaceae bacterium]